MKHPHLFPLTWSASSKYILISFWILCSFDLLVSSCTKIRVVFDSNFNWYYVFIPPFRAGPTSLFFTFKYFLVFFVSFVFVKFILSYFQTLYSFGGNYHTLWNMTGFPSSSAVKNPPANAEDVGSIPGLARSPWEGNGNPLQYSCLENSMDIGAWWAVVHGVSKSQSQLSD